jgi:pantetheine-phosphate adenylyltransferase
MSQTSLSSRIAVYTGSFDPVTLGHLHIIERSAGLYDEVIVAIGINAAKQSLFTIDERLEMLQEVTQRWPNVRIASFDGLAVDYVRRCGAKVMIRGVRPLTDIAGEFTMMMANRKLDDEIETVFLMADENFAHVSSSLIKQIAALSHGRALESFVPATIVSRLIAKLSDQVSVL